jgi:hypothetical protein
MSIYTVITRGLTSNFSITNISKTVTNIRSGKFQKYTKYTGGHCNYFLSVNNSSLNLRSNAAAVWSKVRLVKICVLGPAVRCLQGCLFAVRSVRPFYRVLTQSSLSLRELASARISHDSRRVQGTVNVTHCTTVSVASSDRAIFLDFSMNTKIVMN